MKETKGHHHRSGSVDELSFRHQRTVRTRSLNTLLVMLMTVAVAGCEKYSLDRRMNDLCRMDGGLTVHETVRLPNSEFSKDGVPLARYWLDPSLVGTTARLGPAYRYTNVREVIKAGDPMRGEGRLTRNTEEINRIQDGKLLGRAVWYGRAGGDLMVIDHFSTAGCPVPAPQLLTAVFTRGE